MTDLAAGAEAATAAMRDVFPPTPLARNDWLSDRFGADVWLKREDLTPVRSYKIRGAFNAMRKLPGGRVACASAGNHAQGVAWMCRHLGVDGTIFMPVTTPGQKIGKTRLFGGDRVEVRLVGDFFDATLAAAQSYCEQTGAHFLSPFDDDDVIEGQASVAAEIADTLGGVPDHLILPVGGGGLASGAVEVFGTACTYTFVEPSGAPSLAAALEAGAPVDVSPIDPFVDGAAVAKIGVRTFARLRGIDPAAVIDLAEDRICGTIVEMLNVEGIVLEPAGALSVEALSVVAPQIRGKQVVCVTSGGNFDFERLPEVRERAQRHAGLQKYLILRLPQRPGALRDFLDTLGPRDNITRFEYMKKSARNFGSVLLGIETDRPENFPAMFARIDAAGFTYTDITNDEILAQFVV